MGQSKSKQLYAFQPLPWPEALTAFRLVDQICGIASSYATTHLGDQEGLVLGKVNELQRLPHLWDVFEGDFERLRGSHTLRLATELHNAVEKLEGCKYDMGVLAEKGLMFKSQRKAAYKVLSLLREVEEAHRAFHYAFELALYASMRDESAAATPASGDATPHAKEEIAPLSSSRGGGGGFGGSSRGGRGTSGGGTGFRSQSLPLPLALPDAVPAAVEEPAAAASAGPLPSAAEEPRMGTTNRTASLTPEVASRAQRSIEAAAPAAVAAKAAAPREIEPVTEVTNAVPLVTTAAAARSRRRSGRTEEDTTRRSTARSGGSAVGVRNGGGGRSSQADSHQQRQQQQQYVVMYLPQGPDGGRPRAILVPSASLQPAPAAALPMTTTAASIYGTTGRAGHPASRGLPLPAAAPSLDVSSYFAAQPSQPLPLEQQPFMHYAYAPSSPPPPMTTTAALASKPYSTTSYLPQTRRDTHPRLSRTLSDLAERTARTTRSQAASPPQSYRYFSQAPATAPSLRRSPSTYNTAADRDLPSSGWYGNPVRQHYHSPPPPALRSDPAWSPPYKTTASPLRTAPPVDLDAYLNRPLYSNSNGSSSWWAPPPPPAAARPAPQSALLSSPPVVVPPPLSSPISPAGAVPAVVPGAPPGSIMMLQPLSAHKTATGALVLRPQSDPSRPPMLVVAQDPSAVAAAATVRAAPGVMAVDAETTGDGNGNGDGGRVVAAAARWRRSDRRGNDGDGGHSPYERDANPGTGLYGDDGEEYDDDDEAHLTYTYSTGRTGRRALGKDGDRSMPAYLTHYLGRRDEMDAAEEEPPPPEYYEVDGGGRARMSHIDVSGASGGKGGGGGRERVRDRSGGAVQQLMSRFRGKWDEDAAPVTIPEDSRGGGADGGGGVRQAPHRVVRASVPRSPNARANEVDFPSTAPPRRQRSSPSTAVHARAPALSYERLAALAGLDPDVLGGGVAAGMASLRDRATDPWPAVRTATGNGSTPASAATTATRRTMPYIVPGEPELQRAELLAEAVEGGDWAAAVELAGLVQAGWWGDPRDGAVARGLLLQAALRGGSVDAHAALGEMAERGEGLPAGRPDLAAAARHYGAAATGGHRDATTAYAYLLEHGLGLEQDEVRAAQLYAAAAERNCPTAANNLAKMILDGRGGITATSTTTNGANGRTTATSGKATANGFNGNAARWATLGTARAAVLAAANDANGNGNGDGNDPNISLSPSDLAKALFKRAAKAGSASAWYNLGVCYLQQLKQQQPQRHGGGSHARVRDGVVQPYDKEVDELEGEALRCFAEAAKRGHARAALRAGHMQLQRSAAAAAVEAFAAAAINAAAAAGGGVTGGVGRRGDGVDARGSNGGGKAGGAAAGGAMAQIEAEALWCLAQLAERQASVLEVKGVAATAAAEIAAAAAEVAAAMPTGPSRRRSGGGDGGGSDGARGEVKPPGSSGYGDGEERAGDEEGGGGAASGDSPRGGDATASRRASRADLDGGDGGGGTRAGAGAGLGDDGASGPGAGAESRAVGQWLATLAAGADGGGPEGVTAAAAAATILDDPAATAAVEFARELCRIGFECCRQPTGPTGPTASAVQPSGAVKVRGLRRLRRQARDLLAEADGSAVADVDDVGSWSLDGSVSGGGADRGWPMASELARLDLQLQQPGERAQGARRAAADLMAAAAALGHPAAQHWLAGWQWSMGKRAAAVALWEAAGRRRYGQALMVLGQMAEAGELPAAAAAETEMGAVGDRGGGVGGGADLAAAARYYLRAQEAGATGAVEAMRRVQRLLQRHVALQGKLEAVAAGGSGGSAGAGTGLVAGAIGGSLGLGSRRRM